MEAESSFFYENILQKLFKFRPNFVVPVTDCHFGSPIIRVSTNLYEIDSWLGLIKANAVSAFPKNVWNSCWSHLNEGTNFKASPTLIKSPFILEGTPLAAIWELEIGESMDSISRVKAHRSPFGAPELLLLLAYTLTGGRLCLETCTTVSALPLTLDLPCRLNLETWTAVYALPLTQDLRCRLNLETWKAVSPQPRLLDL